MSYSVLPVYLDVKVMVLYSCLISRNLYRVFCDF